YGRFCGQWRM
ncbi:hypothetical protein JL09_g6570, partial [Pichia kudriavzevii]